MDSFYIIHSLYNEIHDGLNELINEGATSQESQKQKNRLMNIMVSLEAMNKIIELEQGNQKKQTTFIKEQFN